MVDEWKDVVVSQPRADEWKDAPPEHWMDVPDVKGTNPDTGLLNSVDVGFGLRPENPVGQTAAEIIDLPIKYGLRIPLEFAHEKLIEPHRAYSEKQWQDAPEELKSSIPEAFAPLPSKEVFVPVMENAILMGAPVIGAIDKLSKGLKLGEMGAAANEALGKLSGEVPYKFNAINAAKAGTPETNEVLRVASMPLEKEGFPPLPSAAVVEGEPALSLSVGELPTFETTKPNIFEFAPKGTDAGSIRPITFGDVEVGYQARVLNADTGVLEPKYLTKDGKVAQGIVPTQDEFGAHLDFVDSSGKVIARTTADSPEAVMKLGQANRLSTYEEAVDPSASFKGGRVATFTAQDIESGQPTLVIVQDGKGAISTSGPSFELGGVTMQQEVDPTLQALGLTDAPGEIVANKAFKDLTMNEVGPGYEGKGVPPTVPSMGLPALDESTRAIAKVEGFDWNKWTGGMITGPPFSVRDVMGYLNPTTYFRYYFGDNNPVVDGLRQVLRSLTMRSDAVQWKRDLLQGVERATEAIHREWTPIWAQFRDRTAEVRGRILEIRSDMRGAKDPGVKAAHQSNLDATVAEYQSIWGEYAPKYYQIMNQLAKDHPDVRMAFLVEPQKGINIINATDQERAIAAKIIEFFENYKVAAKNEGLTVREGPYLHRPYVGHGVDADEVLVKMLDQSKPIFSDAKYANLSETNFISRIEGVPNMHPSIHASLDSYIKSTPNKLAQKAWETKWLDVINGSDPRIRDYAIGFHDNLWGTRTQNWLDPFVDTVRGAMYLRGVGFSATTAYKHLLGKLYLAASEIGYGQTVAAIPKTMEMLFGNEPNLQRAKAFWLSSRWIFQDIFDAPNVTEALSPYAGKLIQATKAGIETGKVWSMQPTASVELLENGLAFVGGVMKAHGLDFNHEQTMNALLHMAMRANFRGGVGHAPWMGTTGGKAMSTFLWTPMNIAENVVYTQAQMAKNLVNILRGESQAQTAFGENWIWVGMRQLMFWGAAYGASKATGRDLLDVVFHIPGLTGNPFAQMYTSVTGGAYHESHKATGMMKTPAAVYGAAKGFGTYWFKTLAAWKQANALLMGTYDKGRYLSPVDAALGVSKDSSAKQQSTNPWK